MLGNRPARIIVAFLLVALLTIAGCGGEQDAPPSPGTIIEFTNITPASLTVNWTKATDDNTVQQYLEYKVVYQIYDIIGTVDVALSAGRVVPLVIENPGGEEEVITWVQDNTSIDVKNLDDGIEYFFNVVVRDRYWNATAYIPASAKTVDITAPEAGNAGLLEISDEEEYELENISLTLSWTKASDNNTSGPTVLEYRVVYSTSSNIGNVNSALENDMTPEAKQVWTTDIDSTVDIAEDYISGLTKGTCYYFNVLVRDEAGNTGVYQIISQTPAAGDDGTLTISDETPNSVTLNWTKATDSENDPSYIVYRVVYSTLNNIRNVEEAEANDEAGFGWERDKDSKDINLPSGGNYYLNVIVRDVAGIKTVYETITNAPTPGRNGRLTAENVAETSFTLTWEKASDSGSDESTLNYQVFQSLTNNISTVAEIESNGGAPIGQAQGINALDISGLFADTTYHFNVLVIDATGHKAAYKKMKSDPSDRREATSLTRTLSMVVPEVSGTALPSTQASHEESDLNLQSDPEREDAAFAVDNNRGDLIVWLDGCDVSGDSSFSQGRIEIWEDKSLYGNSAVQMVSEKRPVLVDSPFLSNKPVMRFDENRGDTMTVDLHEPWGLTGNYTIFIVADFRGYSPDVFGAFGVLSEGSCFGSSDIGGNIWGLETFFTGEDYFFAVTDGKENRYSSLVVPENPAIVSIVSRENSNENPYIVLNVNGEKEIFRGVINRTGLKSFRLGAFVSDKEDEVSSFSGDIAELLVFKRSLIEDEQIKIRSYLSGKWGLAQ